MTFVSSKNKVLWIKIVLSIELCMYRQFNFYTSCNIVNSNKCLTSCTTTKHVHFLIFIESIYLQNQ